MPEYEFPSEKNTNEMVPSDERVTSVLYIGDTEIVETEKAVEERDVSREELEEMTRSEVYSLGDEIGAELNWAGDDADSREDMVDKIVTETDNNE